ncbi:hypothetical protein GOC03_03275 [Sinorhizobium meliloti]|nr:hypothetical protein [Sinorhizobium meliloti]
MPEEARQNMLLRAQSEMETLAGQLRDIISVQPPKDLLGYIYGQRSLRALRSAKSTSEDDTETGTNSDAINSEQFLLEYVHAVLSATPTPIDPTFDESAVARLYDITDRLRQAALMYAMASSVGTKDGVFGIRTGEIEFRAKSAWVLLRGHRYQVLEEEFYAYVLQPHDDVLREVYGIGSAEIAAGFQAMADASRAGQGDAIETFARLFHSAQAYAEQQGQTLDAVADAWKEEHADEVKEAALAMDDMVRGGICNVSRHTKLPPELLADLAFKQGEEAEFFAEGALAGTPFRTLPARKKPLIELDGEYYAVDPCFVRDAGYRALHFNLMKRRPDYKRQFEERQKDLTENAFADILRTQLTGARIYREVYYRDPQTHQWVENDTLILLDDLLVLVEAKSGAAATIASPASDFGRHARSVEDLVVKAYEQCRRFFAYLASADEVPLFRFDGGKYVEVARIRYADFRLLLPVGLTVESFSPFSAMCKELPGVQPLLGRHPFVSMSIDDLFVLNRFLPTGGELAHYLEVRQVVAGQRGALLFDELDHLGAYIQKNRFDMEITDQLKGKPSLVIWDGMSGVVDDHFTEGDWDERPVPRQGYPDEVTQLLEALDRTRNPGWLKVESAIRTYNDEGRQNLAKTLVNLRQTLAVHEDRYFHMVGKPGLFIWLQRAGTEPDLGRLHDKAAASAIAMNSKEVVAVIAWTNTEGVYSRATCTAVTIPATRTDQNAHIFDDAEKMKNPNRMIAMAPPPKKKLGRNEPCWCGSQIKLKRCHGR